MLSDISNVAIGFNADGPPINLAAAVTGAMSSIEIASQPAHGTVALNAATNTAVYTPTSGYSGPDSFTFTATGTGGVSLLATVSITVGNPIVPVLTNINNVAVGFNTASQPIDLAATVTGAMSSIEIASQPAHGTVVLNAATNTAVYTPNSTHFGADSFTFTATNADGVSLPATVSITVGTPPAPVITSIGTVSGAYNTASQPINLAAAVTGVMTTTQIATNPAHGTVSINAATNIATYTPNEGYHCNDSFTFKAAGPGGVSSAATVSVMVVEPAAPQITPPTAPITSSIGNDGTPGEISVYLDGLTGGLVTGYRITGAPTFGTARIVSPQLRTMSVMSVAPPAHQLVYTPADNFMGTEIVTLVAQGPTQESAPVDFSFKVVQRAESFTAAVNSDVPITFNITAFSGTTTTGLRITRAPTQGTATIVDSTIKYVPNIASNGAFTIEYVVVTTDGDSLPGVITINVAGIAQPVALKAETVQGVPVTTRVPVNTTAPITSVSIVGVAPTTAGQAVVSGANGTFDITFTPSGTFAGEAVVTYNTAHGTATITNTLTITIKERANPGLDPEVRSIATGQVTSARRFADAQVSNFQRRLQQLHTGTNASSNGMSLNLGLGGQSDANKDPRTALLNRMGNGRNDPGMIGQDRERELLGQPVRSDQVGTQANAQQNQAGTLQAGHSANAEQSASKYGFWTAGSVDWGRMDAKGQRDSRFSTQGVTVGLDTRINDTLTFGVGLGYGEDKTKSGDNGTYSTGNGVTAAFYGSWVPATDFYVDGVAGLADLRFSSRRWADDQGNDVDAFADGKRDGNTRFASAAVGRLVGTVENRGQFYLRVDARRIELDGFTENGAGRSALDWDSVTQDSVSANLGAAWNGSWQHRQLGNVRPSARAEWSHELEALGDQGVRYADWAASPTYLVRMDDWSRNNLRLDLGLDWNVSDAMVLGIGYRGNFGDASHSHGGELRLVYGW